jgi:hypothetical protein
VTAGSARLILRSSEVDQYRIPKIAIFVENGSPPTYRLPAPIFADLFLCTINPSSKQPQPNLAQLSNMKLTTKLITSVLALALAGASEAKHFTM